MAPEGTPPGPDGQKAFVAFVRGQVPGLRIAVDDVIAEGDRVAVRLTTAATQVGEFMGLPASNKRYEIGEIHIFKLRAGMVTEHWHQLDQVGMMKQLGAMPGDRTPAGVGAAAGR